MVLWLITKGKSPLLLYSFARLIMNPFINNVNKKQAGEGNSHLSTTAILFFFQWFVHTISLSFSFFFLFFPLFVFIYWTVGRLGGSRPPASCNLHSQLLVLFSWLIPPFSPCSIAKYEAV